MASPAAAIYARISDDKTGGGLGVRRQEEDCRALAEGQGFTVQTVYTDNDISAYSGKRRPGYQRMLDDIAAGSVDVVISWHTDRLHRSPSELEDYIAVCNKHSVTTHTVKGGEIDLRTPEGMLRAGLLGQVARYESAHKAERVRRAQEQKAMSGGWLGGLRPFGWQITSGVPTLDEAEAAIVREAHAHVLAGFSLGSFIQGLTERGITTARGGAWSYATLRQMLLRPRNAGLAEWKGEVVGQSEFPAIVERHIWEATCAVLTDPSRRRSRTNKVKHLLAGIALCECLRPVKSGQIVDRKGVKHMIYRCSESGAGHVNKRISYVDEHVERMIIFYLAREAHGASSGALDPALVESLQTDELAHRERLNEAARLFGQGVIDGEQLAEMSKGINASLSEVRKKLAELDEAAAQSERVDMPDIDWTDTGARQTWDDMHIERKRAWIRNRLVIVLHRHSRGSARIFDPGTVQMIAKSSAAITATPAVVQQWKEEHAAWEEPAAYGIMIQPPLGPHLPSTRPASGPGAL